MSFVLNKVGLIYHTIISDCLNPFSLIPSTPPTPPTETFMRQEKSRRYTKTRTS